MNIDDLVDNGPSYGQADDDLSGVPSPAWVEAAGAGAVRRWRLCRELCTDLAQQQAPYDPGIQLRFISMAYRLRRQLIRAPRRATGGDDRSQACPRHEVAAQAAPARALAAACRPDTWPGTTRCVARRASWSPRSARRSRWGGAASRHSAAAPAARTCGWRSAGRGSTRSACGRRPRRAPTCWPSPARSAR
jgi:hypothetical protein